MNDQTAGNVVGDGGVLRTTLKFFAWADKNHMPIRHMIVDFGDGSYEYSFGMEKRPVVMAALGL